MPCGSKAMLQDAPSLTLRQAQDEVKQRSSCNKPTHAHRTVLMLSLSKHERGDAPPATSGK
jgi:hypothetical protein